MASATWRQLCDSTCPYGITSQQTANQWTNQKTEKYPMGRKEGMKIPKAHSHGRVSINHTTNNGHIDTHWQSRRALLFLLLPLARLGSADCSPRFWTDTPHWYYPSASHRRIPGYRIVSVWPWVVDIITLVEVWGVFANHTLGDAHTIVTVVTCCGKKGHLGQV